MCFLVGLALIEFPAVSGDGTHVAYIHKQEVWTANANGAHPRPLTSHVASPQGRMITGPSWSPDKTRLAYSVPIAGQRDIWLIDADGSHSLRLSYEPSIEDNPSWSSDGRFIYFRSDRSGVSQVEGR